MSSFELFYLKQPRGGQLALYVDGRFVQSIDTAGEISSGFFKMEVKSGVHSFELRKTDSKEVRIFGAVLESGPGVIYDTLGINGAFTHTPERWDAALLEEQIIRRNPQLLITMYGSNDAGSKKLTVELYTKRLKNSLELLRAGAPDASCLLIGPPDRVMDEPETSDKNSNEPSRLDWIIETQQQIADEVGCAFLDTRALMGGPGSHGDWLAKGLAQPDGIHLTVRGYTQLGELLVNELLTSYKDFSKQKQEG